MTKLNARAHELASGPRIAIRGVVDAVQSSLSNDVSDLDVALDAEREAVGACQGNPDQAEGGFAFLEKRKPVFE